MGIRKPQYMLCALALASTSAVLEAKETLDQLATRLAKPIFIERQRELTPAPFQPTVVDADLIVHATVKPIRTYISDDRFELFTEFAVTPLRVLYQRTTPSSNVPAPATPIVFTVWGGRTLVAGVEVELRDKDAARLEDGSEVVLYLRQDGRSYRLVSEVAGILGVKGGRVDFLNSDYAYDSDFRRLRGASIDRLQDEVRLLKK
jgi:hypothetical protein